MAKFKSTPENADRLDSKKKLRRSINISQVIQFLQLCALVYIALKLS